MLADVAAVLPYNLAIMNIPRVLRRPCFGRRVGSELVLALVIVAGMSGAGGVAAVQAPGTCALLTTDEIQPLAPQEVTVATGVATSMEALGFSSCRYAWGAGAEQFKLDVSVNDAARMFAGMDPDAIKQRMQASVIPDTMDAVIPDVGEVAVFRAESPVYVQASTYQKGRILQVRLDGFGARDRKDQLIALLKSAASRL